jgi:lipopolysaccharide biosynthesis protein
LCNGRQEQRTIGRWQFYLDTLDLRVPSISAPLTVTASAERIEVCLLMHLFYPDLWPELAAFARNFESVSRDVFVNVVDIAWTPRFQRDLRELCPGAFVQLSNDEGRDIGGFTRLLDNVDIMKYDFFAFMHSKKSPHIATEKGEYWRRSLLNAFAGSREIVAECIDSFRADPTVGLIAAKEWRSTELGKNEVQYLQMLDLFEIDEQHRSLEYASGTMFLIRSEIVQRIYNVLKAADWEYGGDRDLAFHIDGQLAHAAERVIGNLARQMGYRMVWR